MNSIADSLFREGLNLAREGHMERAAAVFEKVRIMSGSKHVNATYNLAICHARAGDSDRSRELLKSLAPHDVNDPASYVVLGKLAAAEGRMADAVRDYAAALSLDPLHPEANCRIGIALGKFAGKYDVAKKHLQIALDSGMETAVLHQAYAICCHASGDFNLALQHLRRAVELKPESASIHNHLGIVCLKTGREKAADEHFRMALKLNPDVKLRYNNLWDIDEDLF